MGAARYAERRHVLVAVAAICSTSLLALAAETHSLVRKHASIEKAPLDFEASVMGAVDSLGTNTLGALESLEVTAGAALHRLGLFPQYQPTIFQLQTSVGQSDLKIPRQVILTGAFDSLEGLKQRRGNLSSLGITPDLTVRYFNDNACRVYLAKNAPALVEFFDSEKHGSFRGDLCRTVVLAREGGFYVDVDIQLLVPLTDLVDEDTTFMTARSASDGCLNAIIATSQDNPVMLNTLAYMGKWYRNDVKFKNGDLVPKGLLGPTTMKWGLDETMKIGCPEHDWDNADGQFKCGPAHAFRLFQEKVIAEGHSCGYWGPKLCPQVRANSEFDGSKFGLFDVRADDGKMNERPSSDQDIARLEKSFIGWSRFEGCLDWGCDMTSGVRAY